MAEDDALNPLQDEDQTAPPVVPSHSSLPPPPEVHYTRPTPGPQSSTGSGRTTAGASRNGEQAPPQAASHGAGMAAGLTFVTSVVAGLLAGSWLDQHYVHGTTPWATLGMTAVGTAVGFTNMSRLLGRGGRRKP